VLWSYIWQTLSVILQSFAISILLAVVLTSLALVSKLAKDFLFVVTGMFQPLPSIALLPMAILWFGFSRESLVFVVVMSMVWPVASSLTVGFATVSRTLVSLGRNYELGAVGTLVQIMLPAALPMLISGLRVGWGFGWRTVVAAELVFGATGSSGGIGWYINNSRLFMNVADGFAGILLVILIGLAMESIFLFIQRKTTLRWGTEAG
jgi:NitT/TauT family transport system permease protein